jgi:16S rRNA (cytosine967-C5)-methyltransferase
MLLGAYQILHSNIAQHASIYETVDVLPGVAMPVVKQDILL